jgi:hypothetical protein
MRERLRRFARLERPRAREPEAAAGVSSKVRFGAEPEPRPPDVAPPAEGAQPFVRCFRCEADSSVYARTCATCGEELDTPAQRAFNEKLWAKRRAAQEEEERTLATQRAEREQAEAEAVQARREMGETLARETARQQRDRLDAESYGDGWSRRRWGWGSGWDGEDGDPRPLGLRLLSLIRNPRWRIGVAVAILALAAVLVLAAFFSGGQRALFIVYVLFAIFGVLFAPRRRRRWWR